MGGGFDEERVLARLARAHHALCERAATRDLASCPAAVLDLGAAILFHGALESRWLLTTNPVLDAETVAQLADEHEHLADDLELLRSIWEANPESPDLGPLCAALLERVRAHLARDDRMFYRSIPKFRTVTAHRSEAR